MYCQKFLKGLLDHQAYLNKEALELISFPGGLTLNHILQYIAAPYVFLLLVLEDMGAYNRIMKDGEDADGSHITVGDLVLAREILVRSFSFGQKQWPARDDGLTSREHERLLDENLLNCQCTTNPVKLATTG